MSSQARPRGRPRTLTSEQLVDQALALINADGVSGMTMARLAKSLGVSVVTLYNYVAGKEQLLELIVERVQKELPLPDPDAADWRAALREQAIAYHGYLSAHPGFVRILVESPKSGTSSLVHAEANLALLRRAGFDAERAVRAFYAVLHYVAGFVMWELPRARLQPLTEFVATVDRALAALPAEEFPHLHEVSGVLPTIPTETQFLFGLDALLAGFEPLSHKPARRRAGSSRRAP